MNYLCYREAHIERVKTELAKRFGNDSSIELTMKTGRKFLICKRPTDYQVYYIGNIAGDDDCDLVAEVYNDRDLALCIMTL